MTSKFSDEIGKLRSPTSMSLDLDAEDTVYKQIQQAFITTATQLVGMAVALLLYWNYVMLKPYLTPFFWALTFCIVLYKPRQAVINFLKPLSKFEIDPQNDSYKLRMMAKASFFIERITHPLKNFNMVFFVFLVLGYIFCAYIGFYFSIPIFWMLGLPLFIFATSILTLTLCNSKFHSTLVAVWFLLFLCVGAILLFHFFITKSTEEGWMFIEAVKDVLQDPNLQTKLTEYGFTSQFVKDRVTDGQYYLDTWLQSNNVNLTSIATIYENIVRPSGLNVSIVNSMQKDHWQFLQSLLKIDTTPVRRVGTFFLQTGFGFIWVMGSFFGSFYNFVTYLLVFLACLFYLLQSETFFIEYIAAILPIHSQSKTNFIDTLTKSINGIFVGSFLVCISHGLVTYLFFWLLDLNYIYVATFITAFTALFPFVSSSLIFVPVLFGLRLKENPFWWYYVAAYASSQFFLLWILEPFIYRRIPASHPYLTGIAIVLGWSAFGFEGVFLGPMLIVFTITAYDLFQSNKNIALNTSRNRRKKRRTSGRYSSVHGLSPTSATSMDHHVETKL